MPVIPSQPLSNFLIEAGQNPVLFQRLKADPESFGAQAGLSHEELQALLSEDPMQLQAVLGDGLELMPLMLRPQFVFGS